MNRPPLGAHHDRAAEEAGLGYDMARNEEKANVSERIAAPRPALRAPPPARRSLSSRAHRSRPRVTATGFGRTPSHPPVPPSPSKTEHVQPLGHRQADRDRGGSERTAPLPRLRVPRPRPGGQVEAGDPPRDRQARDGDTKRGTRRAQAAGHERPDQQADPREAPLGEADNQARRPKLHRAGATGDGRSRAGGLCRWHGPARGRGGRSGVPVLRSGEEPTRREGALSEAGEADGATDEGADVQEHRHGLLRHARRRRRRAHQARGGGDGEGASGGRRRVGG